MPTTINFVRGLHGMGVTLDIRYQNSRVIFDFGAPFAPLTEIYDGSVLPRFKNRVKDAILLTRALPMDYVYSQKDLQDLDLKPAEDSPYTTAMFISHCHKDHMSEIDKVDPSIPVYFHRSGLALKKALEEIGEEPYIRDYSCFEYEEEITIGEIKVIPYFSDHPCIGSSSYLIETPDSTIVYSGDIRFHGLDAERAYCDLDKISQHSIDLLVVDSTTTSPSEFVLNDSLREKYLSPSKENLEETTTEADIYQDCINNLKDYSGLAIFNLYHRDIRMLDWMIKVGEQVNRKTVFEPETAYIINRLLNKKVNVLFPDNSVEKDFYAKVRQDNKIIEKKDILSNPDQYYIQNSYRNILELIDYDGLEGKYFHLFGEPLTTGEKHYKILLNVLNKLNWSFFSYANLYSFSHAYPNNLAYYIQQMNARSVVAVHSKHPERLNPVNSTHYLPVENTEYELTDGKLIQKPNKQ